MRSGDLALQRAIIAPFNLDGYLDPLRIRARNAACPYEWSSRKSLFSPQAGIVHRASEYLPRSNKCSDPSPFLGPGEAVAGYSRYSTIPAPPAMRSSLPCYPRIFAGKSRQSDRNYLCCGRPFRAVNPFVKSRGNEGVFPFKSDKLYMRRSWVSLQIGSRLK